VSNGRCRKGYINKEDLKVVFSLLNENISDEELNSKCRSPDHLQQ